MPTVPGVGGQVSLTLLAYLPELGTLDPPTGRRAGGCGSLQPGHFAGQTDLPGRSRPGPRCPGTWERWQPAASTRSLRTSTGGRASALVGPFLLTFKTVARRARNDSPSCRLCQGPLPRKDHGVGYDFSQGSRPPWRCTFDRRSGFEVCLPPRTRLISRRCSRRLGGCGGTAGSRATPRSQLSIL